MYVCIYIPCIVCLFVCFVFIISFPFLLILYLNSYITFTNLIGSVREMITFFNKTICKRTTPGQRQSVQNEEYYVHVFMRSDGLCATATCDSEYPPRVAFSLLGKITEDFDAAIPTWKTEVRNEAIVWPALETMLAKYQDPASADQIMKIQKNLDETRDVLHQTIDRYDIMNVMKQFICIYLYLFF